MTAIDPGRTEFQDAWIEGDQTARWRSASGHGPDLGSESSGSSLLQVPPGCRLPRHVDTAEETIVVTAGIADVVVGDHHERVPAGGVALVPAEEPHEVRNAGAKTLRFAAVYAGTDVVSRYEQEVQPSESRERRPVG